MIPQFHPAPAPWALSIQYKFPGKAASLYPGWQPANYPIVGWLHEPVSVVTPMVSYRGKVHEPVSVVTPMVSYRGKVQPLDVVLAALKAAALARAQDQGLKAPGSIDYTVVPA